jgi:hypothetical protein
MQLAADVFHLQSLSVFIVELHGEVTVLQYTMIFL